LVELTFGEVQRTLEQPVSGLLDAGSKVAPKLVELIDERRDDHYHQGCEERERTTHDHYRGGRWRPSPRTQPLSGRPQESRPEAGQEERHRDERQLAEDDADGYHRSGHDEQPPGVGGRDPKRPEHRRLRVATAPAPARAGGPTRQGSRRATRGNAR